MNLAKIIFRIAFVCLLSTASWANFALFQVNGSVTASCPQGVSFSDGCTGAPSNASFQIANFFTGYANQYGQVYATRPPWNVAGVDYPIGYPSNATITIASPAVITESAHGHSAGDKVVFRTTGSLPTGITVGTEYFVLSTGLTTNAYEISATNGGSAINTSGTQSGFHTALKDPAATATLPSGVTFTASDATYGFPAFEIASGSTNIILSYFDYSLNNGTGIVVAQTYTGSLTVQDSLIQPGTNMFGGATDQLMIGNDTTVQSYSLSLLNNVINGDSHNAALIAAYIAEGQPSFYLIRFTSSGNLTLKYNAISKVWGRAIVQKFNSTVLSQYNYWEDCNYNTGSHGEWITTDPESTTEPLVQFSFNSFLTPAISGAGMTAHLFGTGGVSVAGSITKWQIDHSTFVANPTTFPGGISSTTLTVDSSFQSALGQSIAPTFFIYDQLALAGTKWTIGSQISGSPPNQVGTYNVSPGATVADGTTFYMQTQTVVGIEFSNDTAIGQFVWDTNYVDGTGSNNLNTKDTTTPTTTTLGGNSINMVTGSAFSTAYDVVHSGVWN